LLRADSNISPIKQIYIYRDENDIAYPRCSIGTSSGRKGSSHNADSVKMGKFKNTVKNGLKRVGGAISSLGRRNLIVICAVLLIGVAVYLNIVLFGASNDIAYGSGNMSDASTGTSLEGDDGADSYFATAQLSRSRARDEAIQVLQTVVDSSEALEVTKEQALSDMSKIAQDIANESNIETMVLSKGFEECVAVVNGDSVSVIVKTDGLLPAEVAQIAEIVYEQTGIEPINVKIVENND
jgi:stage III sporulation protein AH